jgi:hypothetical protein
MGTVIIFYLKFELASELIRVVSGLALLYIKIQEYFSKIYTYLFVRSGSVHLAVQPRDLRLLGAAPWNIPPQDSRGHPGYTLIKTVLEARFTPTAQIGHFGFPIFRTDRFCLFM